MRVIELVAILEAATHQFVSQCVRNSIMTTHNFHRSYGQNSVEHKRQQISSVSQNTPL